MNILFLDTETTGNEIGKDRLVEVCYKQREEEGVHTEQFKPPLPISIKAMSVTHITNKMVEHKKPFIGSSMHNRLSELLKTHILVAHNAPFDIAMLEAEGLSVPQSIDTLRVARFLDEEAIIPEYNLQFLRYYLDLDIPGAGAHDAESDVRTLEALFERLFQKLQVTLTDDKAAINKLLEISSQPSLLKRFTFGKYKGELVQDIAHTDRGYLQWLYKQKVENEEGQDVDWIHTLKYYLSE
tara:strand:+ start:100 stop:819 length:720 start_codon:yes stop_codon:yes gene_type:complete